MKFSIKRRALKKSVFAHHNETQLNYISFQPKMQKYETFFQEDYKV